MIEKCLWKLEEERLTRKAHLTGDAKVLEIPLPKNPNCEDCDGSLEYAATLNCKDYSWKK